jgi:hypothetical protein
MSTTDAIHDAEEQFEHGDTAAAFRTLVSEVERLQDENQRLQERVDDLEHELGNRAAVRWDSEEFEDAIVESTNGTELPIGKSLGSKVGEYEYENDYENLTERIEAIEDGEADIVIRGEFDGETLPIERKIAERQADGDLSANKARATLIFPKFGGYAETHGGSQLVLSSSDVRTILTETTDRSDWPNETVKRAMTWTAKLTSSHDEKQDWDARDEENLLTLQTGRDGSLELVADLDEFSEFYQRLEEAQE